MSIEQPYNDSTFASGVLTWSDDENKNYNEFKLLGEEKRTRMYQKIEIGEGGETPIVSSIRSGS